MTLRVQRRATDFAGARVPADALPDASIAISSRSPSPTRSRCASRWSPPGEADLVATLRWGHEWDIAAAALIAQEAGATVTDALGDRLALQHADRRAFGVLATTPGIHAAAVERLRGRAEAALPR